MRNLKQALNHGLILKEVHRAIKSNQEAWLKLYADVNTELIKKAKNDLKKYIFKLMNNAVFGKTIENVRKHRDIRLVRTKLRIISYENLISNQKTIMQQIFFQKIYSINIRNK